MQEPRSWICRQKQPATNGGTPLWRNRVPTLAHIRPQDGPVNILNAYATILSSPDDTKDPLNEKLDYLLKEYVAIETLFNLGDLNIRVDMYRVMAKQHRT